jgi:hypothetical protein
MAQQTQISLAIIALMIDPEYAMAGHCTAKYGKSF